MCSRYSLTLSAEKVHKRFELAVPDHYKPRYNAAPGQNLPVITDSAPDELSYFQWGLIPNWSLNDNISNNLINGKAETALTKSPVKQIIRIQRCLIPADGYYEWLKVGKNRVPHRITLNSDEAFSFAGVWDSWVTKKGDVINSFTILTTTANEMVREFSDRMPVILPKEIEKDWLKPKLRDEEIQNMLQPYPASKMSFYKSHRVVNNIDFDTPECIHVAPKIYPGESYSLFD